MALTLQSRTEAAVCLPVLHIDNYPGDSAWTVPQAAHFTGVSEATLRRLIRAGKLQAWSDPETGDTRLLREATKVQLRGLKK